ncbi:MAG: radical SAM protein [Deltaproteobacteria bacterium]|nr:radical SAM protein [Deltaproteobacteria bacterium]
MQGCPFDCTGCFNPGLKDFNGGKDVPLEELIEWALSIKGIEGISISGGEPTEQLQPLNRFLTAIKEKTDMSVLLFSGRSEKEIIVLTGGKSLLNLTDVLVAGQYTIECKNSPGMWPSSANQEIMFLTDRYDKNDFLHLPETEIIITDEGEIVESGLGIMNVF